MRFYLVLFALALTAPFFTGSLSTAGVVLVFAIAAAACNLLLGYAGILSFAQGSFFGLGSYAVGILLTTWPGLGLLALPLCVLGGALLALCIGLLSTRQKGIYSVMITLAMAQLVFFAALSFPEWTGGENGLLDVPRPTLGLGRWLNDTQEHYLLVAVLFVVALAVLDRMTRSPFGRVLDAVRDNETRAEVVGFHVPVVKLQAFCLSGGITALAGALYALQLRSAPLSSIDLMTSESILIMSILGGRRSMLGAAFGALAMILMGEMLSPIWPRWQMVVGAVLIGMVLFAPDGLAGLWQRLSARRRTAPDRPSHMQQEAP